MAARWLPSIEGNVCDTLSFRPLSPQTLGNRPGDNVTTVGCFGLYKGLKAFKVECIDFSCLFLLFYIDYFMKMFDRSVCLKILSLYYIEQEHLRFPFSYIKMSPYILFKDSYI